MRRAVLRDDQFRHRLRTAALALDEQQARPNGDPVIDQVLLEKISEDVCNLWTPDFFYRRAGEMWCGNQVFAHLRDVVADADRAGTGPSFIEQLVPQDGSDGARYLIAAKVCSLAGIRNAAVLAWLENIVANEVLNLKDGIVSRTVQELPLLACKMLLRLGQRSEGILNLLREEVAYWFMTDESTVSFVLDVLKDSRVDDETTLRVLVDSLALGDPSVEDWFVCQALAETLGFLASSDDRVIERLCQQVQQGEPIGWVSARALGFFDSDDPRILAALRKGLLAPDTAGAAAWSLGQLGLFDEGIIKSLRELLDLGDGRAAATAAATLGLLGANDQPSVGALIHAVSQDRTGGSGRAAISLGLLASSQDQIAVDALLGVMTSSLQDARATGIHGDLAGVIFALKRLAPTDKEFQQQLMEFLEFELTNPAEHLDVHELVRALEALAGEYAESPIVLASLGRAEAKISAAAAHLLSQQGRPSEIVVQRICELLSDPSETVRSNGARACVILGLRDAATLDQLRRCARLPNRDAVLALGWLGDRSDDSKALLLELLMSAEPSIVWAAVEALNRLDSRDLALRSLGARFLDEPSGPGSLTAGLLSWANGPRLPPQPGLEDLWLSYFGEQRKLRELPDVATGGFSLGFLSMLPSPEGRQVESLEFFEDRSLRFPPQSGFEWTWGLWVTFGESFGVGLDLDISSWLYGTFGEW
jgi:hypothetical protein